MKKLGNVLWGIIFIALGVIIGLNALEITDINLFFDGWWTLFVIVPSFIGLIKDNDKMSDLIGLFIGIILFMCCQDLLSFDLIWKLMFPAILIIIGINFIFKDIFNKKMVDKIKEINKGQKNSNEYTSTFSSQKITIDDEKFEGTTMNAIFGGIELDLRKAIIKKDVVINTTSIFGGVDIFVPSDVKVKINSTSIFGGVSDEDRKFTSTKKDITIYINATSIFGGVEIK